MMNAAPQHVRVDTIETSAPADRLDPPVRGARVEPLPVGTQQDRTDPAFADGLAGRSCGARRKRDPGGLVALADDLQGAMPAFGAEILDIRRDASLTRNPFRPSSTASAACIGLTRSAVNKNRANSSRSIPRRTLGCTRGRRTCRVRCDAPVDVRVPVVARHRRQPPTDPRRGQPALLQ
jgi:hypothetical protein